MEISDSMRIDAFASQSHYVSRLAPVWRALSEEERGRVEDGASTVNARREAAGLVGKWGPAGDAILTAGWGDARATILGDRKSILMEHGTGQRYGEHPAYAGGSGRKFIKLFLCPNQRVARLNRASCPESTSIVVGDTYMDHLDRLIITGPKLWDVAISFHAELSDGVAPEAGTTWREWKNAVIDLHSRGYRVIGHAHPRDVGRARDWFAGLEIPFTSSFERVVSSASVYVCDNSSTIYYAAALEIPVVLLNSKTYRRYISHGGRFWEDADVGWQVNSEDELAPAVDDALCHPYRHSDRAHEISNVLFPRRDGMAGVRAAEAIRAVLL